ncbi:MAG: PQQ-binding-like beta-propeller repeat protein [Phycisphaeraceae bacterium]
MTPPASRRLRPLSTLRLRTVCAFALALLSLSPSLAPTAPALAEDWPQFLGPSRDGIYRGDTKLASQWPRTGPAVVWKKKVGEGFAAPVVVDGKVILYHRVLDREVVDCLDAATGEVKWSHSDATDYTDDMRKGNGPRATPAVADGRIILHNPDGILQAVDFTSGKTIWKVDTVKQFRSTSGFFGRACSPLIEDSRVLLNIGGPQAGIGAFDAKTGELLWKATGDEAGYASPACATVGDKRIAFFFTRAGLVAADPKTGEVQFQQRWRSRQHASVNAATPLIVGDLVVLSSSYQTGATVLDLSGKAPREVWAGDDILSSQYVNVVHHDGFLYGFDGRNDFGDTRLRCVDLKTGKVQWTQDKLAAGPIVLADGKLFITLEGGELLMVEASPKAFNELGRAAIHNGPVRAYASLADGFLFVRDEDTLVCVDLRPGK